MICVCLKMRLNTLVTNELSLCYHFDESTFIYRGFGCDLKNFAKFFNKYLSKQNSPRCDASFCGVTSGAILFAYIWGCSVCLYLGLFCLPISGAVLLSYIPYIGHQA